MKSHRRIVLALITLLLLTAGLYATVDWTSPIDYPGASLTDVHGINTAGHLAGSFVAGGGFGPVQGFSDILGVFTPVNYPGAIYTAAFAINDNDDIVGNYIDSSNVTHGFLLQGQTYVALDPPGSKGTWARGINNAGQIVGYYQDSGFAMHGFELIGGTYTNIDIPQGTFTEAFGINNNGDIVGLFTSGSGNRPSGFILSKGVVTTVKFKNLDTTATAINDQMKVTGFVSNSQRTRAFIYLNGKFVIFGDPEAPTGSLTYGYGINNSGFVVGSYLDITTGNDHGFERSFY